jgi:type I restriction enzyme S subunit
MAGEWFERTTFAQLIADGALEIGDGYRAKNEELGGDGLIFLRAGHVTDTHINFDGVERFHRELEPRVISKLAKPGDAVITTKGNSTGRTTFVSPSMPPFVYSPHLSYWRSLDPNRIEGGFLRYWCKGSEFTTQLAGMKASTDMAPYLSLVDQKRLEITLPPIDAQRAIAHILGTLDDKIELNRRMNETLEAMARALFKSWFVDFDPVRAKAEARDPGLPKPLADVFPARLVGSKLGEIPARWEVRSLDEIARFLNGLALQKYPPKDSGSLPVIKIAQLRTGNTEGADVASAELEPDYIVEDGDVLFSWSGSLECVLWAGGRGALNQHLFKVTSSVHPKWFYYLWIHQHLDDFRYIAAGKATTMGHIQRHHLSGAKVVVPPSKLLHYLDLRIAPLVDGLWRRSVQSRTLAALRDTLLPKLISGELRVKDAKKFIERRAL